MTQNLNNTTLRTKLSRKDSKRRTALFSLIGASIGGFVGIVSAEPLGHPRNNLADSGVTGQLVAELIGYLFVPAFLGAVIGWLGARRTKAP